MQVICSYCRASLGEKEPLDNDLVSHGMCEECIEYFTRQWNGLSLGEYLDRFDVPVLVADEEFHIIAANQEMADMLGKEDRQTSGLLGGEAMECIYARLEEGCGNTVHCSICAVRNAVNHTVQTGESLHRIECYVERDMGREPFLVSTVKLERSVQVVLEPAQARDD